MSTDEAMDAAGRASDREANRERAHAYAWGCELRGLTMVHSGGCNAFAQWLDERDDLQRALAASDAALTEARRERDEAREALASVEVNIRALSSGGVRVTGKEAWSAAIACCAGGRERCRHCHTERLTDMSGPEDEPEGGPHGECAHEISALRRDLAAANERARVAEEALAKLRDDVNAKYWDGVRDDNTKLRAHHVDCRVTLGGYVIRAETAEAMLRRMVTYVTEDRATTPGVTRLARLVEQARKYIERTPAPPTERAAPGGAADVNARVTPFERELVRAGFLRAEDIAPPATADAPVAAPVPTSTEETRVDWDSTQRRAVAHAVALSIGFCETGPSCFRHAPVCDAVDSLLLDALLSRPPRCPRCGCDLTWDKCAACSWPETKDAPAPAPPVTAEESK